MEELQVEVNEVKAEKTGIQKSIIELRRFLPKNLAGTLGVQFGVTPEYVRLVWQGVRENVEITETTLEEIKTAKKRKAELDKKVNSVIG